jgi:hypothetical protein
MYTEVMVIIIVTGLAADTAEPCVSAVGGCLL